LITPGSSAAATTQWVRDRTASLLRHCHPPGKVAAAIVDAVDRNRAVVFVGREARLPWMIKRAAPISLQQRAGGEGAGRERTRFAQAGPTRPVIETAAIRRMNGLAPAA
jgi:hypothetical protein